MLKKPDFIIMGAQKSASTYVQRALVDHPGVFLPDGELRYFEDPWFDEALYERFLATFQGAPDKRRIGFKRADMLALPECSERVKARLPDAQLVVILRHPVDRATSAYFHYLRYDSLPFADVEAGMRRILDGSLSGYPHAARVLDYGLYARHLERWFSLYDRDRVLVLLHDNIQRSPQESMETVYAFLGLDTRHRSRNLDRRSQAVIYSLPRLRFLRLRSPFVFHWNQDRMASTWRFGPLSRWAWYVFEGCDRYILGRFLPNDRPRLSEELDQRLRDFYRDDVARLRAMLPELDVPWTL